jgi:hypothetical protein
VQSPLELRDPETGQDLAVAQRGEAFAAVQLLCRLVRGSRLRDRAAGLWFRPERRSEERDADSSPEEVREHREPVEVDRRAVEFPRDHPGEAVFDMRPEERLAACLQLLERLVQGRYPVGADEARLHLVCPPLQREDLRSDACVGKVEQSHLELRRKHGFCIVAASKA